ncbi:70 kDa neurofilament protein-like [Lineus longissimus]|uniref:70 kDa neurofilament protein-like n=1 Tax=Lineus longissimus TaxID=88925 RepID=UPI00315D6E12
MSRVTKTTTSERRAGGFKSSEAPASPEVIQTESFYKSSFSPRQTIIQRTGPGSLGKSYSKSIEMKNASSLAGHTPSAEVTGVKNTREREKRDMQDLNERFAGYIEKVRFLEAQNRKLASELEALKSKWGIETSEIKRRYEIELKDARSMIDELTKEKSKWEIRCHTVEEELTDHKAKLDDFLNRHNADREALQKTHQQLSDYESEIALLRRRIAFLEEEHTRDKVTIKKLNDDVYRLRVDLDNETLLRIAAENERQTLEEELAFLKTIHEQELKELAALAYRDSTAENREYWKSELAVAIRDIQHEYEDRMGSIKTELEAHYNLKMSQVNTGKSRQNLEMTHYKEETQKLRNQLQELRSRISDLESRCSNLQKEYDILLREYQDKEHQWDLEKTELIHAYNDKVSEMEALTIQLNELLDAKLSLELEIAAYRKLLEGDGSLGNVVEKWYDWTRQHGSEAHLKWLEGFMSSAEHSESKGISQSMAAGEMSAKTTYQRSAKGNISIKDAASDGKSVTLENTGNRPEDITGWKIKRIVDHKLEFSFDLPSTHLARGQSITVFAKGQKPSGAEGYETSSNTWGVGANVTTYVFNVNGEERATYIQKTMYS